MLLVSHRQRHHLHRPQSFGFGQDKLRKKTDSLHWSAYTLALDDTNTHHKANKSLTKIWWKTRNRKKNLSKNCKIIILRLIEYSIYVRSFAYKFVCIFYVMSTVVYLNEHNNIYTYNKYIYIYKYTYIHI